MSKQGKIQIFLEKPYYLSGETVVGRVDLDVFAPVAGAKTLMIKWKGFERTLIQDTQWVQDPSNPNNKVRKTTNHKQEKDFFKKELVVFSFNGGMAMPGKHSFPFNFQLPQGLPSVFYYQGKEGDGDVIRAAVVYKVKCWLDMPGKDIKTSEKIIISEAVTKAIVPIKEENKKSFLLARGSLKMKVEMDKNVFIPGETLPIKVHVDNESSKKVDALKVKLMRNIIIRARGMKKDFTHEVYRMKYDGVGEKTKKDVVLNFQIDGKTFPSCDGELIDCKYHLDVECDVARAIDLEVHPKITVALLPAAGQPVFLFSEYAPHAWH